MSVLIKSPDAQESLPIQFYVCILRSSKYNQECHVVSEAGVLHTMSSYIDKKLFHAYVCKQLYSAALKTTIGKGFQYANVVQLQ